jgi:hypothetical protein
VEFLRSTWAAWAPASDVWCGPKAAHGGADDLAGGASSTAPRIVLAGSSYSEMSDFTTFLQNDLGFEIHDASVSGGGFGRAMLRYLTSSKFLREKPEAIIWEMPERALRYDLGADETALQAWSKAKREPR